MTIRVMLGASTSMVRSALRATLGDCADIEIVRTDPSKPDARFDVLVLQPGPMRNFADALERMPRESHLGVVAIDENGEAGDLYRIYRTGWRFQPGGRSGLADAIRLVASAG